MGWNIKRRERKKKKRGGHVSRGDFFEPGLYVRFVHLSFHETGWHAPTLEPRSSLGN